VLSGTAEYALRAVVCLARSARDGEHTRANDLAEAVDVPRNYLSKILHELTRAGILKSSRGKNGGFQLAVPPDELPLLKIVQLFDRMGEQSRCLLGRPECSDADPCPAHPRWKATSQQIAKFFRETTIADVIGNAGSVR
jgi:Rrf2 family protein